MSALVRTATLFIAALLAGALDGCSPDGAQSAPPAASSAPASSSAPAPSSAPPASTAPPDSGAPPASGMPAASSNPALAAFAFDPAGQLQSGAAGVDDATVYAPGIRFPIEQANAYANSQVYGHGGESGPGGGQCDAENYAYPWHDNFCEPRAYTTPLCPSGTGHQGQDIRPNTCKAATWTAVAVEPGVISQIGTYTVYLSGDSGRTYLYLHMQMDQLKVHIGDRVTRGQPLGLVSNNFGATSTTIHLHFEIKEPVTINGATVVTRVPPYSSLVDAYQALLAGDP
jgi:murein DD-endopeptidase MepM/ murein hydrolase activator NlpD